MSQEQNAARRVRRSSILKSQNAPTSSGGGDGDGCSQTPTRTSFLPSSQEPRTDAALPVDRKRRVSFAQERTVQVFQKDITTVLTVNGGGVTSTTERAYNSTTSIDASVGLERTNYDSVTMDETEIVSGYKHRRSTIGDGLDTTETFACNLQATSTPADALTAGDSGVRAKYGMGGVETSIGEGLTTMMIDADVEGGEEDMELTRCQTAANNRTTYDDVSMDLTRAAICSQPSTTGDSEDTGDFLTLMTQKKKRRSSVDFARTAIRRANESRQSMAMELTNVTRGFDDNVDEEEEEDDDDMEVDPTVDAIEAPPADETAEECHRKASKSVLHASTLLAFDADTSLPRMLNVTGSATLKVGVSIMGDSMLHDHTAVENTHELPSHIRNAHSDDLLREFDTPEEEAEDRHEQSMRAKQRQIRRILDDTALLTNLSTASPLILPRKSFLDLNSPSIVLQNTVDESPSSTPVVHAPPSVAQTALHNLVASSTALSGGVIENDGSLAAKLTIEHVATARETAVKYMRELIAQTADENEANLVEIETSHPDVAKQIRDNDYSNLSTDLRRLLKHSRDSSAVDCLSQHRKMTAQVALNVAKDNDEVQEAFAARVFDLAGNCEQLVHKAQIKRMEMVEYKTGMTLLPRYEEATDRLAKATLETTEAETKARIGDENKMMRLATRDDELSAYLDKMEAGLERYITRRKADDARVAKAINDRAVCRDLGVRIVEENVERIVFEFGGVRVKATLDDGETVTHVDVELKPTSVSTLSSSLYTHILRHHTVFSPHQLLRRDRDAVEGEQELQTVVSHIVQSVVDACSPLEELLGELEFVKHELKEKKMATEICIASTMGDTGHNGLHYITDDGDDSDKLCIVSVNSSSVRQPHMSLFFRLDPIAYPKNISALAVKSDSEDVLASATANHDRSVVQKSAMPIYDTLLR